MPDNRLDKVFKKDKKLLSVFFTAGYPELESTVPVMTLLQESGIDFVEIGFPFSDPVADGAVIQKSNQQALANGMTLEKLFAQLKEVRKTIDLPLILMGYLNPVEQFGFDRFLKCCKELEIDGLILPDMPLDLLESKYKQQINAHNMHFILLASPTSSPDRIRKLDSLSTSFLYAVSSTGVTGGSVDANASRAGYFESLKKLNLKSPIVVGFGLDSKASLDLVYKYFPAGIIGSAFLKAISGAKDYLDAGRKFLAGLRA